MAAIKSHKRVNESTVKQFQKSVQVANREREGYLKALASKDPERAQSARKKMRDRSAELRRLVSTVKEDDTMLTFKQYLDESVKKMFRNHLHDYQDDDSGWHTHNKTDTHTIRRGFFYKHGGTSEKHAAAVSAQLTAGGITHKVVDHGEVYGKPFRGGASVKHQDHWWTKVKLEK
jgi:uncharacterized protein YhaN